KALAVVGGAVVGGLTTGAVTGFCVRRVATQKFAGRARWTMRGLGGVTFGWLTALLLFGGGGGYGLGGTGGLGLGGTGTGSTRGHGEKPPPGKKDGEKEPAAGATALTVEVLGRPALQRLRGGANFDPERCFRVEGDREARLLTLAELKQLITERLRA